MSEYWNGNGIHVYDFDKCIAALKQRHDDQEKRIEYLKKENKELKNNNYKDSQLQEMKDRLDLMTKEYNRGFPISEDEQKAIDNWKEKHEAEIHGVNTAYKRLSRGGVIGGEYQYVFTPTSIGVIGTIKCKDCGGYFTFQDFV